MKGSFKFKPGRLELPLTFPRVVTTATCPAGTINKDCVRSKNPVKERAKIKVAAEPGLLGVTFLKGVVIE